MTLRQLIKDVGVNKKRRRQFKSLKDFKFIENCEIYVPKNISDADLLQYFNSKYFTKDVSIVINDINITISKLSKYSLTSKNFCLFFLETKPINLNAHALLF